MDEYRKYLSEKLYSNSDYDISNEIRDIERLKKRFGEGNVQKCEVMLHDVKDSKRINTYIHEIQDQQTFVGME